MSDTNIPDDTPQELLDALANGNPELTETPAPAPTAGEDESRARRHGWVPRDEFTGDPERWVDAKTFNDRGRSYVPNLERTVKELTSKVEKFQEAHKQLIASHAEQLAKKDAELKEAIQTLRNQRAEAISNGDGEGAVQLEERIDVLKDEQRQLAEQRKKREEEEKAASKPSTELPPEVEETLENWVNDGNEWFKTSPTLRAAAIALGDDLRAKGETLTGRAFLDKVSTLMAEEFPERVGKRRPSNPRAESSTRSGARGSNGRTAADLPRADRDLMELYVEQGLMTEADFLKSYFSRT